MKAYLINLARRPDRLHAMATQLRQIKIPFEIVHAIDAHQTSDDDIDSQFATTGPLGAISKGDKCCTLSHRRAWEAFLQSHDQYGLILEDDVILDHVAGPLLLSEDWIPSHVGLLKLEQYLEDGRIILVDRPTEVANGYRAARLRSKHTGAAAYILSRPAAQLLCGIRKWTLPVDHMLFNPNNSPLVRALEPHQLLPAIARQSADIGGKTDIEEWREGLRTAGARTLLRELRHSYYELRLLPIQIMQLFCSGSHIVKFEGFRRTDAPSSPRLEGASALAV